MKNPELSALSFSKDCLLLAKVFGATLLLFQIVFYKEPFFSTLLFASALAIVTYVPGFFLATPFFTDVASRLLFGSAMSIVIIASSAYYFGLLGINISITAYILPFLLTAIGIWVRKTYLVTRETL